MNELFARFERDCKWRDAWGKLANHDVRRTRYRLQNQQEYIERRANIANLRVGATMRKIMMAIHRKAL
jgi:hypothetical protein